MSEGINIGPPRVRGKIFQGTLEYGVDPDILRWLQKPYLYDTATGKYYKLLSPPRKGQLRTQEIIWKASPWPQGSA